jgi:uncharacterized protein (TIGR04222 family)
VTKDECKFLGNVFMNPEQQKLYQRIGKFSLDEGNVPFPFSRRLAKEKGWSTAYTQRAIAEYKKYAFLAVAAGHPVSPSKAIDEVWHLHLTYTQSYWDEFCPKILGKSLHHYPSNGDRAQNEKFDRWYHQTLTSYQSFFGEQAPADIWEVDNPIPKTTFSTLRFFSFSPFLLLPLLLEIAFIGNSLPNPLNFPGSQFLNFYLFVLTVAVFLAYCVRWYLRKPGENDSGKSIHLDIYETAYLAEGTKYILEVAIAHLVQKDYLKPVGVTRELELTNPLPNESHPLEKAVIEAVKEDRKIDRIRSSVYVDPEPFREKLTALGMLIDPNKIWIIQLSSAFIMFMVLLLGAAKILIGISREKPVGFLIVLCLITLIIGGLFLSIKPSRSRFGDIFLSHLHSQNSGLEKGQNTDVQLGLAIALFGTSILNYSSFSSFTDLRKVLGVATIGSNSGGSCGGGNCGGGDSGGGGCGGGGCGGGGCGGCGGGGD